MLLNGVTHKDLVYTTEPGTKEDHDEKWYSNNTESYFKWKKPIEVKILEKLEGHDGCSRFTAYKTDKGYFCISTKIGSGFSARFIELRIGNYYYIEPTRYVYPYYRWKLNFPEQKKLF